MRGSVQAAEGRLISSLEPGPVYSARPTDRQGLAAKCASASENRRGWQRRPGQAREGEASAKGKVECKVFPPSQAAPDFCLQPVGSPCSDS